MDWLKFFRGEQPKSTASVAKERLQLVVAHQRDGRANGPVYLPKLREELLSVVRKYVKVPDNAVQINVQREDGLEVLEMNITLPDAT
ncbi:MAG TPA: cell division topological specificity factor MinE [Solimonas sp.]|nr:cell division topological specificity factor MinE [Solimonas sp.]